MARRRFFVSEVRRGMAELSGADAEHLVRVLRAEAGQVYELSDNRDAYLAQIETARKSLVVFRVLEKLPAVDTGVQLTLAPALFKFDRFEWLIEKATELGVDTIQPWEAARTERGLRQAAGKRIERWRRIALEASQQARRVHLPVIEPVMRFREVLRVEADLKLLLDEDSSAQPIGRALSGEARHVTLLSGPEGGWTAEEKEAALAVGWQACSLGSTILRAETAGMAGLAIVRGSY